MKKIIALVSIALCLTGCQQQQEPEYPTETEYVSYEEPTHTSYIVSGRYYTSGQVITQDGNIWDYSQDTISEKESYDNEPVFAIFDDNGTPDDIYDDELYGLVLDLETEIYDKLEVELSKSFTVEREGNNLHIAQK